MTATVTQTPVIPTQAEVDTLMSAAVRSLAADGITPQHVLSWDVTGEDRAVGALATALERYMAAVGSAAVLAASGPSS